MRVQMVTLAAGPAGVREIGKVYDLEEDEALALLDGGYALPVSEPVSEPGEDEPATPRPRRRSATA